MSKYVISNDDEAECFVIMVRGTDEVIGYYDTYTDAREALAKLQAQETGDNTNENPSHRPRPRQQHDRH